MQGPRAEELNAAPILELRRPRNPRPEAPGSALPKGPAAEPTTLAPFVRPTPADVGGIDSMVSLRDALREFRAKLESQRATTGAGTRTTRTRDTVPPSNGAAVEPERCPICGGAGYLRQDLPPDDPFFGQAVPCTCKEREIEEKRRLQLDRFFSLKPFADKTFGTFNSAVPGTREAFAVAQRYAADPMGWLVLSGGYGCGKTHLAAAIAHYHLAAGSPIFFAVVPDLLDHLRAAFAPTSEVPYDTMFDTIREVDLLVLDDLGAENSTAWATEKLFQLINYRYNFRMPTVITTNNQLQSRMDERIRSRLADLSFVQNLVIKAGDYRPRNARRRS
jgi:DNA replication protein DnaC